MIGCGFMGRTHSNAHSRLNNFFQLGHRSVLKAICDTNAEKAQAFADNLGLRARRNRLAQSRSRPPDIDLIDICAPNFSHAEIAIAAAQAGKIVICEKPLARTVAEAAADGRTPSKRPASPTWCGSTTAACPPSPSPSN